MCGEEWEEMLLLLHEVLRWHGPDCMAGGLVKAQRNRRGETETQGALPHAQICILNHIQEQPPHRVFYMQVNLTNYREE